MGILSKNLRYVCRNLFCMNPLLNNVSRRGYIDDSNLTLLLHRRDGNGTDCFTELSGKNFSVKNNFYPPYVETETDLPEASKYVESSISCNGLLCLDYGEGKVVVWNPSTNKYKLIPHTSPYVDKDHELSFDATCFGFDPTSNDYKILRLFTEYNFGDDDTYPNTDEEKYHAEVYSLKNDFWKDLPQPQIAPTLNLSSVLINGCYYFSHPQYLCRVASHISCYDITKEEFTLLPLPDIGSNLLGGYGFDIMEFDGLLSALVYPRLGIHKCFDVWVRMNGLWDNIFTVKMSGVERPLGFWKKGQYMFFQGLNNELIVFDRATGNLKNLGIYGYITDLKNRRRTMKLFSHLKNQLPLSD